MDRLREFLGFALQSAILLGCLVLGSEAWLENRANTETRVLHARQRQQVIRLAISTDPDMYFRSKLVAAVKACRRGIPLERIQETLKNRWGLETTLYRFGADLSLKDAAPWNAPNRRLMEQIFRGLLATEGADIDRLTRSLNSRIPVLFGYGKDFGTIRNQEGLPVEVFLNNERGMLFYRFFRAGGILILLQRIPSPEVVFRIVASSRFARENLPPDFGLGQGHEENISAGVIFRDSSGGRIPAAEAAFQKLPPSIERSGSIDGQRWVFLETLSGRRVFGAFPNVAVPPGRLYSHLRVMGLSAFIGALMVLALGGNSRFFRLRRLLLGLFLAAASIPLAGIILGSIDVVEVYRMVRGSRLRTVEEGTLRNLISGFDRYLRECSEQLRAETASLPLHADPGKWHSVVRRVMAQGLADRVTCRDVSGKILLQWPPGPTNRNETVLGAMGRYAVERYAPERLAGVKVSADPIGDAVVRNDDMGFATIINHPGELQILQFGQKKILDFFRVFPVGDGPIALVQSQLDLRSAFHVYLKRQALGRNGFAGEWLRLLALDAASMQWILPPPRRFFLPVREAALASLVLGRPEPLDLNPGSAVSLESTLVPDLALVSFSPGLQTEREIAEIWRMIGLGGILFLALTALLGRGLTVQLLDPLRHLEDGVQALGNRDFEFQLPSGRGDELGRLFEAFNHMMEGARDFELARHVQEGLIPREFPTIQGYQVDGKLITASDLGGDLIDAFLLPDGRLCFYVGDVAGHGVGAALMMAFARAVVFHRSSRENFTLLDLADDLDRLLRRRQEADTFLGLVCGLLDPGSGRVELISAGMPFPLLRRARGGIEWIGTPTLPLGSGSREVFPTVNTLALEHGDALLFYSDGFVEAFAGDGKMIGYTRFGLWVESLSAGSGSGLLQELLDLHQKHRRGAVTDDVTVLVVRREQEKGTPE